MDVVLTFLVPLATGLTWAGTAAYQLMNHNELRRHGTRVEAQVIGPVPGVQHSRSRGPWVINPLLSFTAPDGRTVRQGVGSKRRPIRVREEAHVVLFHAPDDPRQLAVEGHGVRGRACFEIVLGLLLTVAAVLLLVDTFSY
ncbi:DUF3592 domain-containing protein [Streptomyces sp. NPDC023723]|uniref:DUF3592 domain-containing protein n=1 Tax=Streptomyces sp. NPDC023723 TaxID=3154323 RepID=UPI0033F4CDB1